MLPKPDQHGKDIIHQESLVTVMLFIGPEKQQLHKISHSSDKYSSFGG